MHIPPSILDFKRTHPKASLTGDGSFWLAPSTMERVFSTRTISGAKWLAYVLINLISEL